MANEITEPGQIVTYGGPQLTLAGSTLASKVTSILTREGSGSNRAWKIFDPTKSNFLNTKQILYPGDIVLVNAKTLPMDFTLPATNSNGGGTPLSYPITETASGPNYEIDVQVDASNNYLPSFAFTSGTGTLQMQLNGSGSWVAAAVVTTGNTAQFRIVNTAPFSGTFTLTPQ